MKRTNTPGEWTDGKDIYVGNPKDGFKKKTESKKEEPKKQEPKENYSLESWGDDPDSIDTLTVSEKDYLEK